MSRYCYPEINWFPGIVPGNRYENIFKNILACEFWDQVLLIHEKNQRSKISCYSPFNSKLQGRQLEAVLLWQNRPTPSPAKGKTDSQLGLSHVEAVHGRLPTHLDGNLLPIRRYDGRLPISWSRNLWWHSVPPLVLGAAAKGDAVERGSPGLYVRLLPIKK